MANATIAELVTPPLEYGRREPRTRSARAFSGEPWGWTRSGWRGVPGPDGEPPARKPGAAGTTSGAG